MFLVGALKPGKCLFVVRQSQIGVHESGSRNVTCLLPSFQFSKKAECFGATSRMRVRSDKHGDYSRTTLAESYSFFQRRNRFLSLTVGNQRETKEPVSGGILRAHCQIAAQFANGFLVVAGLEQDPSNVNAANTEWVELSAPLGPFPSLLRAALTQAPSRISEVRPSVIGVQFEGQVVFCLGIVPLPLLLIYGRQQGVCFRNGGIQFQGLSRRADHFRPHFSWRSAADARCAEFVVRARQAYICRRKRRVLVDGLLKLGNAFFHSDLVIAVVEHHSEVALINIGQDLARGFESGAFWTSDGSPISPSDGLCHLALQDQGITELAVVGLRPEMLVGVGPNQLHADTNLVSRPHHGAFADGVDI